LSNSVECENREENVRGRGGRGRDNCMVCKCVRLCVCVLGVCRDGWMNVWIYRCLYARMYECTCEWHVSLCHVCHPQKGAYKGGHVCINHSTQIV